VEWKTPSYCKGDRSDYLNLDKRYDRYTVDFRIYNIDEDDKTKNDHFRNMIDKAEERGFNPEFVLFDTWYASVKNLKAIGRRMAFPYKIKEKSFGES